MYPQPLISIITPVYNVQEFLDECIDSVAAQDFPGWELILVDDGSTDSSPVICSRRAGEDCRIRFVRQSNGGQSRARNAALDFVRGKYIVFLDSDDILAPYALSTLLDAVESSGADIVAAGFVCSRRDFNSAVAAHSASTAPSVSSCIAPEEAVKRILYQRGLDSSCSWKIFRASLWKDMRFLPGKLYEDLELMPRITLAADKIALIPDVVYYYRQNPSSTVHTFSMRRLDVLDVTDGLLQTLPPGFGRAVAERRFSAANNIFALLSIHAPSASGATDRCWTIIRQTRRSVLTDCRSRLKSRAAALFSYLGGRPLMRFLARIGARRE